ncbi:uncharacterized protein LOC144828257 [Lissotriton helveticus]
MQGVIEPESRNWKLCRTSQDELPCKAGSRLEAEDAGAQETRRWNAEDQRRPGLPADTLTKDAEVPACRYSSSQWSNIPCGVSNLRPGQGPTVSQSRCWSLKVHYVPARGWRHTGDTKPLIHKLTSPPTPPELNMCRTCNDAWPSWQ